MSPGLAWDVTLRLGEVTSRLLVPECTLAHFLQEGTARYTVITWKIVSANYLILPAVLVQVVFWVSEKEGHRSFSTLIKNTPFVQVSILSYAFGKDNSLSFILKTTFNRGVTGDSIPPYGWRGDGGQGWSGRPGGQIEGRGTWRINMQEREERGRKAASFCNQWHLRMTDNKDTLESSLLLEINWGLPYLTETSPTFSKAK